MKNAWLCREADADVLGYWAERCPGLAAGAMGRTPQGGQGSRGSCCFLQEVVESLGAPPLCSTPLFQSPPDFCREVNTSQGCPTSRVLSPIGVRREMMDSR